MYRKSQKSLGAGEVFELPFDGQRCAEVEANSGV